ncbi:MAG: hypothetical protein M0018_01865 [Nitrospiraceae bacterium]|nr:hypothetical protein [Nitrospiraceae bacterium]
MAFLAAMFTVCLLPAAALGGSNDYFSFPPEPAPWSYGNVIINTMSPDAKPVTFSHWVHRIRYTCRVCHFELNFSFTKGGTGMTMEGIVEGKYCGVCHNGTAAFGPENCNRCHDGGKGPSKEEFDKLTRDFPKAGHGNHIDWTEAVRHRLIKPVHFLHDRPPRGFPTRNLVLQAEWSGVPPAIFPHTIHRFWLDCNNCHPDPFNIKKKGTPGSNMMAYLNGKFCGVCHGKVSFPLQDCRRCHVTMQ